MDFAEVVRRRHMTRAYADRVVPRPIVDDILDAGLRAPTAGNTQGTAVVVLDTPEDRARFWEIVAPDPRPGGRWAGMRTAPVVLLPTSDPAAYLARYSEPDKAGLGMERAEGWPAPYWEVDLAFAVMSMLLAATANGLGALFFGVPRVMPDVFAALGIPPERHQIGALTIGWEAPDARRGSPRPRAPRDQRVQYGPRT